MRLVDVSVSVAGVAITVALVWLATGSAPASLQGEADARARFARELPGFALGRVLVDRFGRAALARSPDTREVALLFVVGRRIACWRLPAASVTETASREGQTLRVDTGDFTRPHVELALIPGATP